MLKKIVSTAFKSRRSKEVEEQLNHSLVPRVPFLQGAGEEMISELAAAIEPVEYDKDGVIFHEGDQGDSLYLIAAGSVRISSEDELIAELGVGGCFGEGALFRDGLRGATVVAADSVTLYRLNRDSFDKLAEKYKKLRFRLRELHEDRAAKGIEHSIEENLLSNAPFLKDAGGSFIQELARLLEQKDYAKGDVLIQEGEEGACFFLVEDGTVGVYKSESQIAELGPGACLGEGAILSGEACSATVRTSTDVSCLVLGKDAFLATIKRYPVFGSRLREIHKERTQA